MKKQPATVALNASAKSFQFYRSGVVKSCCDPNDSGCTEHHLPINHAVAVVGYSDGKIEKKVTKCSVQDWWVNCREVTEKAEGGADA